MSDMFVHRRCPPTCTRLAQATCSLWWETFSEQRTPVLGLFTCDVHERRVCASEMSSHLHETCSSNMFALVGDLPPNSEPWYLGFSRVTRMSDMFVHRRCPPTCTRLVQVTCSLWWETFSEQRTLVLRLFALDVHERHVRASGMSSHLHEVCSCDLFALVGDVLRTANSGT